jgi:hypothetical protein
MATQDDVRRVALTLPGTVEAEDGFAFSVTTAKKPKQFAWVWMQRVNPRKPRVARPDVLAIRVTDLDEKDMLLSVDGDTYFTEPHYDGYPAVLVRLERIDVEELTELLADAWRCQAPADLLRAYDTGQAS